MNFLSIFKSKSLKNRLGGTPREVSDLGATKFGFSLILNRFLTLLGTPLGAQVGSNFEALRRLGASRGVLRRPEAVWNPLFFRSHERYHFPPLSDPKITPKIIKK